MGAAGGSIPSYVGRIPKRAAGMQESGIDVQKPVPCPPS